MGRPRKHPTGTTDAERAQKSLEALKKRGGARKSWLLSPEAHEALQAIQKETGETETAIVRRLLVAERDKLTAKP